MIDGDWATLSLDAEESDMDSRRAYFEESFRVANKVAGQCRRRLFEHIGLLNIQLDVQPVFKRDAEADCCWQPSQTSASDADGRFASANVVLVSGQTPC